MFKATSLLKQWNSICGDSHIKKIDDYFRNKATEEFIETIIKKENLNTPNQVYLKIRGKFGDTWMNPMFFIDFAM